MLIDIDDFKWINDQFGHASGDEVIVRFANLCKKAVDESGIVGRWGGEEFIVFLSNHSLKQAKAIATTILKKCELEVYQFSDHHHIVTASIGISQCQTSNCNIESLIQTADKNMYQAKQQGKNQIVSPED